MELEWGYKAIAIPLVNITYYTIKLRFSDATFGWIWLPPDVKVTSNKGYHTIKYVTSDPNEFIRIKDKIMEGQQAQMQYILEQWIKTKHKLKPMHAHNPNLVCI